MVDQTLCWSDLMDRLTLVSVQFTSVQSSHTPPDLEGEQCWPGLGGEVIGGWWGLGSPRVWGEEHVNMASVGEEPLAVDQGLPSLSIRWL